MAEAEQTIDINDPTIKALIAEAVERETSGLIQNRDQILREKRELAERYKDLDVEEYKKLKEEREKTHNKKLKDEGNIDELLQKQESVLRADYESKLEEISKQLQDATRSTQEYQKRLHDKTISDVIRDEAIKAGVLPEAINDIVDKGIRKFTLSERGELESRTVEGDLSKDEDGFIVTPARFIANLRKTNAYYWGSSHGAGLNGSSSVSRTDDAAKMEEAAAKGDMATYRKLRAKLSK